MGSENLTKYGIFLAAIVGTVGLLFTIFSSEFLTEAQKYFVVNMVFLAYVVGYIIFMSKK